MIFFFDENMPPKVAAALQALGTCEARHLVDHLPRGTPDGEVFTFVASQRWLLITQDVRMRRNPHQRRALRWLLGATVAPDGDGGARVGWSIPTR